MHEVCDTRGELGNTVHVCSLGGAHHGPVDAPVFSMFRPSSPSTVRQAWSLGPRGLLNVFAGICTRVEQRRPNQRTKKAVAYACQGVADSEEAGWSTAPFPRYAPSWPSHSGRVETRAGQPNDSATKVARGRAHWLSGICVDSILESQKIVVKSRDSIRWRGNQPKMVRRCAISSGKPFQGSRFRWCDLRLPFPQPFPQDSSLFVEQSTHNQAVQQHHSSLPQSAV